MTESASRAPSPTLTCVRSECVWLTALLILERVARLARTPVGAPVMTIALAARARAFLGGLPFQLWSGI